MSVISFIKKILFGKKQHERFIDLNRSESIDSTIHSDLNRFESLNQTNRLEIKERVEEKNESRDFSDVT